LILNFQQKDGAMKKITAIILLAFFLFIGNYCIAYSEVFLRIPGIPGESQYADYKDWIEVKSWSWQMSAKYLAPTGGLDSSIVRPLIIVKQIDKASPLISFALLNGSIFADSDLAIAATYTDAGRREYLRIRMWNLKFVNVSPTGEADDIPIESVAMAFSRVCYKYTEYDDQGRSQGAIEKCWDIAGNKPF
jgi:type VI secretion system secreted protein Hcp